MGETDVLIESGGAETAGGRRFKDTPAIDAMSCGLDVLKAWRI
ncbi:MAG: hypothetical protein WDM87_06215 [Terracidiphilus sp.]